MEAVETFVMRIVRIGMSRERYECIGFRGFGWQYSKIPNNVIKFDINEQKFLKHLLLTGAGGSVGVRDIR